MQHSYICSHDSCARAWATECRAKDLNCERSYLEAIRQEPKLECREVIKSIPKVCVDLECQTSKPLPLTLAEVFAVEGGLKSESVVHLKPRLLLTPLLQLTTVTPKYVEKNVEMKLKYNS
eukprot:1037981-Amphidinium_carterae.1